MYKHILVPLDGSAAAEAALDHVFRLADRFEARITVLMVTGLHLPLTSSYASLDEAASMLELAELDRSDALSYLASLGERLQSRGLNVSVRQAEGAPARVICEIAAKIGADLIAMTTHARGGLRRVFFGSVAEEVVRHVHCPVLLVRAVAEKEHRTGLPERWSISRPVKLPTLGGMYMDPRG